MLTGFEAYTVYDYGVDQLVNGELLAFARENVDIFLTYDRGIPFQHNHRDQSLIVVVMATRSTELKYVEQLLPSLAELLAEARPGLVATLSLDGVIVHQTP